MRQSYFSLLAIAVLLMLACGGPRQAGTFSDAIISKQLYSNNLAPGAVIDAGHHDDVLRVYSDKADLGVSIGKLI
jgi:hypothetical protein